MILALIRSFLLTDCEVLDDLCPGLYRFDAVCSSQNLVKGFSVLFPLTAGKIPCCILSVWWSACRLVALNVVVSEYARVMRRSNPKNFPVFFAVSREFPAEKG